MIPIPPVPPTSITIWQRLQNAITLGILHVWWNVATLIGTRWLGGTVLTQYLSPSAYGDTIFYFEDSCPAVSSSSSTSSSTDGATLLATSASSSSPIHGLIALTIDDGFVRSTNATNSMVPDVLELLARYGARATFMVCTKYTTRPQVQQVMRTGEHELGNHLYADTPIGLYTNMAKEDFRTAILDANRYLLDDCEYNNQNNTTTTTTTPRRSIHWFRAPQGAMSKTMREVLYEENMTNVLGDIYCDDWAYAEYNTTNTTTGTGTGGDTSPVAPLMLQQVDTNMRMNNNTTDGGMGGGSVAIFHMPERGFRETTLEALEAFLLGLQQRNIQCITLTEMSNLCSNKNQNKNNTNDDDDDNDNDDGNDDAVVASTCAAAVAKPIPMSSNPTTTAASIELSSTEEFMEESSSSSAASSTCPLLSASLTASL